MSKHHYILPTTELSRQSEQEIRDFQEAALQQTLKYLNEKSPYYSRLFKEQNIDLSKIRTLENLHFLPITTKDDLHQHNHDFICVPQSEVADYVTTSGTLGSPITYVLTESDLERLAYNEATSLSIAEGGDNDIYQLMCTMDKRFMAGLAYYMGARKLGASTVRVGAGEPELQWDSIHRFSPTILITVPSFLLKLIEFAVANNIDFKNSSVRKAVCIGEPIRNANFSLNNLGRRIKEQWDIELFSTYASTEMSTAFTECSHGNGGHLIPELIILELLDENNFSVAPGYPGEVTITTLGVEGMPLLRFKTGDICHAHVEPCACGRNSIRLGPIIGRRQQMIKYKGTTLYPESLFNALNDLTQIENYVVEVSTNELGTDDVLLKLGAKNPNDILPDEITSHLRGNLRVVPRFEVLPAAEVRQLLFPTMSRKPIKFIDKRLSSKSLNNSTNENGKG